MLMRCSFITTDVNPYYDSFVRWQFEVLHKQVCRTTDGWLGTRRPCHLSADLCVLCEVLVACCSSGQNCQG